jgi:hypothetical protein
MTENAQAVTAAPPRRPIRRAVRFALCAAVGLILVGMAGWMFLAVRLADRHRTPPRTFLAAAVALTPLVAVAVIRRRRVGLLVFAITFAAVLAWYFTRRPSHQRDWAPEVAVLPSATIDGDIVRLHHVRNFEYRSENDFTPTYEDRTYDLSKLRTLDFVLSYWAGEAIAHALLSFGFDDGRYVAISIETRKEKGEAYSAVEGFFRQYELIYVVADERDLIGLRTNHRGEEVYLYRLRAPPEKARAVLLDYLATVNDIHERPRFYNALTENCTTSIFAHLFAGPPPDPKLTPGVLLSGYSAEYAHKNGGLDQSMPFEELKRRSHINDLAKPAGASTDFSKQIRARLTVPQPPASAR